MENPTLESDCEKNKNADARDNKCERGDARPKQKDEWLDEREALEAEEESASSQLS